jgi:hypothetical protein
MVKGTRPPKKSGHSDIFQTPIGAVDPILPFLRKDWRIWECSSGHGNIAKYLRSMGFEVMESDLSQGKNFLTYQPDSFDCIITNPPYSIKDDFLRRAYYLKKPFAFLLPITALEGKARQVLYREYGLEVIFMDGRINFETPSGKGSGAWFATAWFTCGLNIGKQMTFSFLDPISLPLFEAQP